MTGREDAATAAHESGHAVISLVLGLPVSLVAIGTDEDCRACSGFCAHHAEPGGAAAIWAWLDCRGEVPPEMPAAKVLEHLLAYLGGPLAEARFRRRAYHRGSVGAWRDLFDCGYLIGRALREPGYSQRVEMTLRVVETAAADLVRRHWPAIEHVASALAARRVLTGAEIQKVMGGEAI